jgi:hypothetical protein
VVEEGVRCQLVMVNIGGAHGSSVVGWIAGCGSVVLQVTLVD